MRHVKVEGHPNLVRDVKTGAILNINKTKTAQARIAKEQRKSVTKRIDNLETDISEIKAMLKELVGKNV